MADSRRRAVAPKSSQRHRADRMKTEPKSQSQVPSDERNDLQVLAKVEDNNFVVDSNVLYEFLKQSKLEGRPLVVVSISGAFRSGKSFIMNFFLRYLRNEGWQNKNWAGADGTEVTGGFPWRRGHEACTKGITIWPEVFSVPTPDGRQAAVIIVDTQGLFDDDTSPDINAKLMSLSTLFCSHQILNIMRQIEERDLEHLQLCIAFAKVAASIERRKGARPFQKLTFLVRDWEHNDNYGDGTLGHLRDYFSKQSKSPEVQEVKKSISLAFDEVRCTLLPHPGMKVVKPRKGHTLTNKDIEEEFRVHVSDFVCGVLNPENLVVKRSKDGGEETTTGLMNLLATVGRAFEAGKIPTAETLLASVVKGNNRKALISAVAEYKRNMRQVSEDVLDQIKLQKYNRSSMQRAKELFHSLANMGGEEQKHEFLLRLEEECKTTLDAISRKNDLNKSKKLLQFRELIAASSEVYTRDIKKVETSVDEAFFDKKHDEYQQRAMSKFDAATDGFGKAIPEIGNLREELVRSISSSYEEAKSGWKERKLREREQNRQKCSALQFAIKDDLENYIQRQRQYIPSLQKILKDKFESALSRYDNELKQNPEKTAVQEGRKKLQQDMENILEKALRLNSGLKSEKVAKFHVEKQRCLTDYKSNINKDGTDQHEEFKDKALGDFDSSTDDLSYLPEVKEIRRNLSKEIDAAKEELEEYRRKVKAAEETAKKLREASCTQNAVDDFENEASESGWKYAEDPETILEPLEEKYKKKYKDNLSSNGYEILQGKLSSIKQKYITKHENYKNEIENLGKECAGALQQVFDEDMAETYVEKNAFDETVAEYKKRLQAGEPYTALPPWGKIIVDSAVQDEAGRLEALNEKNKEYRAVNVSKPNIIVRLVMFVVDGVKGLWNRIRGKKKE